MKSSITLLFTVLVYLWQLSITYLRIPTLPPNPLSVQFAPNPAFKGLPNISLCLPGDSSTDGFTLKLEATEAVRGQWFFYKLQEEVQLDSLPQFQLRIEISNIGLWKSSGGRLLGAQTLATGKSQESKGWLHYPATTGNLRFSIELNGHTLDTVYQRRQH